MMNSAMRLLELPGFVDPFAFGGRESFGFSHFVFPTVPGTTLAHSFANI